MAVVANRTDRKTILLRGAARGRPPRIMEGSKPEAAAVRDALEKSVGPVTYADLRAHLARDVVFVVDARASLIDCGVAIATNDVRSVERLIAAGALRRPTPDEQRAWSEAVARQWLAIVVQPFVLVQDAPPS